MQQFDFKRVSTPGLGNRARSQFLMSVLNTLSGGVAVTVAITYDNQTDGNHVNVDVDNGGGCDGYCY